MGISYRSHSGLHRRLVVAVVVLLGITLSACGGSSSAGSSSASPAAASSPAAGTDFRVLYIGPLSGATAIAGKAEVAGLRSAAAVINSQGGILGHRVTVSTIDDGGVGTTAVSDGQRALASGTQYNLIVGGTFGADAIPLASLFAKTPVLQITQASEPELNNPSKYPFLYVPTGGFGPQGSLSSST